MDLLTGRSRAAPQCVRGSLEVGSDPVGSVAALLHLLAKLIGGRADEGGSVQLPIERRDHAGQGLGAQLQLRGQSLHTLGIT